jgi:hypothetical protein
MKHFVWGGKREEGKGKREEGKGKREEGRFI